MARLSSETWRELVEEFEEGHETQQAFANRKGVNVATFRQWLYKLRGLQQPPAFLPVQVLPAAPEPPRWFEVALRSGLLLRFPAGTDPSYVTALVAVLA